MGGRRFAYILVLLGVVLIASVNGEKSASPGCRVLQLGKKLQCRGVGLSKIPKIPKGILIADFTDNLITHITQQDWKNLEKLQKVYLKGNPFHCDCNLESFRLKLDNSPAVIQDGDSIQCATPSKIHNKHLKSLSNLCDVTEHEHSRPILSIQKRNAQPYIDKCKGMSCEAEIICPEEKDWCECSGGFDLDVVHRNCKDINECEITPNICSGRFAICTNTNGSYECNCKEGYHNTSNGCQDFNECNAGAHKCDETTSKCQNTIGGHFCICRTGFNKTQDKCVDINECEQEDRCGDSKTVCQNTFGSYTCSCKDAGYRWTSQGCEDIDECKNGAHKCDEVTSKCRNKKGSYTCVCLKGYKKEKDKCADIDECKVKKHNCSKQSYCRNTRGGFKCVCPKGYKLKRDGVTCLLKNKKNVPSSPAGIIFLCIAVTLALLCLSVLIAVMVRRRSKKNLEQGKIGDHTEGKDIVPVARGESSDGDVEAVTDQN